MRGPRPRPGLKKRKIPRHAGNFILRSCVRRTTAGVSSAPKPSQYAVGEGFHARPAPVDGSPVRNGARAVPAGYDTWGGGRYCAHRG